MKAMTDRNPHTGEKLQSKPNNNAYRDNFDAIFRKPKEVVITGYGALFDEIFPRPKEAVIVEHGCPFDEPFLETKQEQKK